MIFNLAKRFASRIVQRAHARVTAENAVYVAEAIKADAKIARLTQERDRYKTAAEELRRKQERQMELTAERIEELDRLRVQVQDLADQLDDATGPNPLTADNDRLARELEAEREKNAVLSQSHADLSGQLWDALERLAGYELAEAIADEARAKRYHDGLGDE